MLLILIIIGPALLLAFSLHTANSRDQSPRKSNSLELSKPLLERIGTEPQYHSREKLLSEAEASFFGTLKLALGDGFHISAKVRMADVLEPTSRNSNREWWTAFNQIAKKHLDYVICKNGTWEIVAVVELDDSSHNRSDRVVRDAFLDFNFYDAAIPLVRVKASAGYSVSMLRTKIEEAKRKVHKLTETSDSQSENELLLATRN